jgi:PAS domain S-box-containing protein
MACVSSAQPGLDLLDDAHLRALFHAMPVLLVAFDPFGRILCWNAEAERVTGYSFQELRQASEGRSALEVLYPNAMERAQILAEWSRRGNDFRDWRLVITCKDQSLRMISWSCESDLRPIKGWGVWLVGREVTGSDLCLDFAI